MIPASAIDRIEILTDGASSLYGSDAVAGVVNIIPRKAFRGAETNITQGTADGTANELQISQLVGLKWSGGHVMAAYEYEHRGRLGAEDRSFFTEDLRRFGGPDARSPYGDPGTIFAVGQSFAIPGGQDGRHLTASQLVAGTQNLNDDVRGTDILPRQTRHSVYAAATQAITSDLSVYASGLYTHRDFDQRHVSIFGTALTVTSANPFYVDPIGTGDPIMVDYRLSDAFGTEHLVGRAMGYTAVAGATLDHGAWEIDLHGSFGRQVERYHTLNAPNFARLDAALADPDPATAFNPFGSMATDNDPALIDTLRGFQSTRNRYAVWSVATKADGPLIDLPAGALRIAIGGEVRADRFGYASTDGIYSETPSSFSIPTDERKLVAGFAEVRLPIFSPDHPGPLARRLDLAASVRIEHYNDFGTTTNPKVGLSWEPVAGLTTRANYGTSFRAPGFNDLRQGALFQLFYTEALADPRAPTGFTNALVLVGNKPGIGPERARTITAGFEAKPSALPGLTISATWFDIRYRDRIEDLSGQAETVLANRAIYQQIINDAPDAATVSGYYASPSFSNFGNIAAGDIQAIVDVRNQNLAIVHEAGLDFDIDTTLHLLGGQVDIGLAGTYLFYLKQAISRSAPATNLAGTTGNPTPLRWRAHAGWNRGPFGFTSAINYTDAYRNTLVIPTAPVKSYLTVDAQLSWDIARKGGRPSLRLALNATNLFDRRPPFVVNPNGLTTVGYDPDNASAIGRDLSIQLTARW
jgi:outer membrane receptor protein involved in Fe transport